MPGSEHPSRVQVQYVDLAGFLRGVEVPHPGDPERINASTDGSSVFGFQPIEDSDLFLRGDPATYAEVPWIDDLARILAFVEKPEGGEYTRDPRTIAARLEKLLGEEDLDALVGVEVEYFLFDDVKLDVSNLQRGLGYSVESEEQPWTGPSFAMIKKVYHAVPPADQLLEFRVAISQYMDKLGFKVEAAHHEVAVAQVETGLRAAGPLQAGDGVVTLKWAVRSVAPLFGYVPVFMPKPVYGDNGSGMHLHLSLWRGTENLFHEDGGLSQLARYFIGGILEHARSLAALVSPTTNSYRRLVPGYEAPVYIAWGHRNRSAMIRIPAAGSPQSVRVEFRTPDPSANPYLAIAATILAGLDGIRRKIDPGDPLEKNAYTLTADERKRLGVGMLPKSLDEALDELESDNEYLKPVFTREALEAYIEVKRREAEEIRLRPHPYEFYLYGAL